MEQRLKKLGVVNSKDRARMMGSLLSFKKDVPSHRKFPCMYSGVCVLGKGVCVCVPTHQRSVCVCAC